MKTAKFIRCMGYYVPMNKDATAICAILSKMRLKDCDMLAVRSYGYTPFCGDVELGNIDISV